MILFEKPLISEVSGMLSEILTGLIKMIHLLEEKLMEPNQDELLVNSMQIQLVAIKTCAIIIIDHFEQRYHHIAN